MSRNISNFALSPGSRRTGVRAYDYDSPNNSNSNSYEVPVFYRSLSTQNTPYYQDERTSSELNSWPFLEERAHSGLYSLPDFPPQAHRIFVLNGDRGRGFRESTHQQSVPTPRSTQAQAAREDSRSKTLGELKKQVYDPNPTPKLLAKRVSLYYRDGNGANALEGEEKEQDERRCTICLEEFEPKIEVMVTPCNHMFHEDCILPWLERQGKCPICRSEICKRRKENRSSSSFNINNSNHIANVATPTDLTTLEFFSILRAMEQDVQLPTETRGFFFN